MFKATKDHRKASYQGRNDVINVWIDTKSCDRGRRKKRRLDALGRASEAGHVYKTLQVLSLWLLAL